ncbi:MAG: protein translocase subunit SecF [Candidatus Altiarchaeota archaeon]
MSAGIYEQLTKKVDYRILTIMPWVFGILAWVFILVNGIEYGIDFKGGVLMNVLTENNIDSAQLTALEADLAGAGLSDAQANVGFDIDTGKNNLVIQTTSSISDRMPVEAIVARYAGKLTEYDTATVALSSKPPVELQDNLQKRLKQGIDANYTSGVLTLTGLDLNKEDLDSALSGYLGQKVEVDLTKKNFNIRSVGPTFGQTFKTQAFEAVFVAFLLMSVVVFFSFREVVPCVAVIQAAVFDISIAIAGMSLFGIPLEPASLAALLMLIGYSVDTDILLTTRVLKERSGDLYTMVDDSIKTGLTMTGTTVTALTVVYLVSTTLTQVPTWTSISAVLIIGLLADIPSTWLTNVGLLKWYLESKGPRKAYAGGRR